MGATEPLRADRLSVVIVTYDSAGDLERCLPALLPQLEDGDELVVVDNSPGDETATAARRLAPGARVIESGPISASPGGATRAPRRRAPPCSSSSTPIAFPPRDA